MPEGKFSAMPSKNIRDLMPRHFKNRLYPSNETSSAALSFKRAETEQQSLHQPDAQNNYKAY